MAPTKSGNIQSEFRRIDGYLASVTDPAGNATRFTYSADGLMSSMTDPNGGVYTFAHDAMGKLTKDQNPVGGGWTLTSSKTRTTQTSSITSAEGRVDTTLRERLATGGERMTMTSPSGVVTVTETLPNASSVSTGADGTVTTTTKSPDSRYGMMSPVTNSTVKLPSGLTSTTTKSRSVTLSNPSDPLSVTSSTDTATVNGLSTKTTFNKTAMTVTNTSPMNRNTIATLDAYGRVIQNVINGIDPVKYVYDAQGRLSGLTQGLRTSTYSHDSAGKVSSITDALGLVTSFVYDSAGRAISQTLPDGRVIYFTYDANGNVTSITPPSRPLHGFTYTGTNLEASYNPPDIGIGAVATQYAYNLDKQLTTITRPDGKVISYGYDTGGRLLSISSPDGSVSHTYGPNGCPSCGSGDAPLSVSSTTNGIAQNLNYSYDGSLLTSTIWSGAVNGSVARTIDPNFKIRSLSINGSNTVTNSYDRDGLLTGAGALSIARNAQNGFITGTALDSITTSLTYNTFGETAASTAKYNATTLFETVYTRDAVGRIAKKVETVQGVVSNYDYQYDTTGRLIGVMKSGVPVSSYIYDANGNRTTSNFKGIAAQAFYDLQDRLVTYGNSSYTYTPNGELASKIVNGQTTSFAYDVFGNLTQFTLPDGTFVEYVIDGKNRRVGKKVNGALVQGLLYINAIEPIAELDGAGNVVSHFVYGTRANIPDYMIKDGIIYRIISDHLGSPRIVINTSTGAVAQRIDYDEYGIITLDTNPGFQPFGFAGGIYDQHTKLTRHGVRDYDAEIGRWTSKYPIMHRSGEYNYYSYSSNDPTNYFDPQGTIVSYIPNMICAVATGTYEMGTSGGTQGGSDKYKHCYMACKIMRNCGPLAATAASIGKELVDLIGFGTPDIDDLGADGGGMGCAMYITKSCESCCKKPCPKK